MSAIRVLLGVVMVMCYGPFDGQADLQCSYPTFYTLHLGSTGDWTLIAGSQCILQILPCSRQSCELTCPDLKEHFYCGGLQPPGTTGMLSDVIARWQNCLPLVTSRVVHGGSPEHV